jgi:hypothetical protein
MKQGKIVDEYGTTCYYTDDQLHRDDDLPAMEWADGDKAWYQNDQLHRDNDLPAVEYINGARSWYQNGKSHRLAGPAWITDKGAKHYFIDGKWLTKKQHANHPEVKKYKLQQILNRVLNEPT